VYHYPLTSTDTLKAEDNWWGSSTPQSIWFSTRVDYIPWLTEPPAGKRAIPSVAFEPVAVNRPLMEVGQNYPNPFNPATSISFTLTHPALVRVDIFNILGQLVRPLVNSEFNAGRHEVVWDGTDNNRRRVASGVYIYRVSSPDLVLAKKMVLLK
jgi:hypothetical protein